VNKALLEPARRAGKTDVETLAGEIHADLQLDHRMPALFSAPDAQKLQKQFVSY